eukprot:4793347-Pyramimonas_sp.AAC.1
MIPDRDGLWYGPVRRPPRAVEDNSLPAMILGNSCAEKAALDRRNTRQLTLENRRGMASHGKDGTQMGGAAAGSGFKDACQNWFCTGAWKWRLKDAFG